MKPRAILPVLLALPLLVSACTRAPLQRICPTLGEGDLVITEVRGAQDGVDTWGQWIEIQNASDRDIQLAGVQFMIMNLDGSSADEIMIRDHKATVASGGYFVLGRFPADMLPGHINYGYKVDLDKDMYSNAVLELYSCGKLIDQIVWTALPALGSYSFNGGLEASAGANDDKASWCADITPADPTGVDGGASQIGLPGTPGRKNHPCK